MKQVFSWLLVLSFLLALSVPAAAANDATGKTLRLEETTGSVTVRDASGKNKAVRAGMRLYSGYTVETGASSSAYISLDETKAVKLDSSGKAEIKKSGKKLEVALTAGQIFFNVTQPLKVDESLNIRTSTMVTGIRGSFGWVNPTQLGLMHGHVTLTCTNPDTGETRATEVFSGEKVSYEQAAQASGGAELAEIGFARETIVVADVPAIVVEEVKNDATLQTQLAEDAAAAKAADENAVVIDVTELVESLETKQAEEKAAEETARAAVEEAVTAQEEAITAAAAEEQTTGDTTATGGTSEQVFATATTSAPSDDSGGSYTPAPTSTSTADASELSSLLSSYEVVTYTGGSGSVSSLTVPAGKTLVLNGSDSYTTLTVTGSLTNSGTINVQADNSLTIGSGAGAFNDGTGTINVYGDFSNLGSFSNSGNINVYSGG